MRLYRQKEEKWQQQSITIMHLWKSGGAITDDGFSLFAYKEDGIDLLGGVRVYIAFK